VFGQSVAGIDWIVIAARNLLGFIGRPPNSPKKFSCEKMCHLTGFLKTDNATTYVFTSTTPAL
jgi:hypothetical protein